MANHMVEERQTVHSVYVRETVWQRWLRKAERLGYGNVSEMIRAAVEVAPRKKKEPVG